MFISKINRRRRFLAEIRLLSRRPKFLADNRAFGAHQMVVMTLLINNFKVDVC